MRNVKLLKSALTLIGVLAACFIVYAVIPTKGSVKSIAEQLEANKIECAKNADSARLYVEAKVRMMAEELKATQQQIQGVKIVDAENITKVNDLELSLGLLKIAVEDLQKQVATSDSNELAKKVAKLELEINIFVGKANVTFQKAGELFAFLVFKSDDLEKRIVKLEEQLQRKAADPCQERSIVVKRRRLLCR